MSLKLISNGLSLNKHQDIISPWPFFLCFWALLAVVPLWPELRPHSHSNEYANNFLRHTHIPGTPLPRLALIRIIPPSSSEATKQHVTFTFVLLLLKYLHDLDYFTRIAENAFLFDPQSDSEPDLLDSSSSDIYTATRINTSMVNWNTNCIISTLTVR